MSSTRADLFQAAKEGNASQGVVQEGVTVPLDHDAPHPEFQKIILREDVLEDTPKTDEPASPSEKTNEDDDVTVENSTEELQTFDYMEDDEEFLLGDDTKLFENDDSAAFKQLENVVAWRLDNFYNEDGSPKSKSALRSDPPLFRVTSSDGAVAEFLMTPDLAASFERVFSDVHKGFYGVTPKGANGSLDQDSVRGQFGKMLNYAKEHQLQSGFVILVVLMILVSPLLFG